MSEDIRDLTDRDAGASDALLMQDRPEPVDHDSSFWREDARMREARLQDLANRIEAQRREAAALEQDRARLEEQLSEARQQAQLADIQVQHPDPDPDTDPADTARDIQADLDRTSIVEVAGLAAAAAQRSTDMQTVDPKDSSPAAASSAIPADFGFEDEHPQVKLVFTLTVDGRRYTGESVSFTHVHATRDPGPALTPGSRHMALLQIPFDGFTVTLQPELTVQHEQAEGHSVFRFADPTGPHLPQLRYILNSVISGDVVSMDGMMSYSGPLEPKTAKAAAQKSMRDRLRSVAGLVVSVALILAALSVVISRYTTAYEMHPVYVTRDGQQMRATTAGQVAYLNPQATQGEVLFAVNANTGDVLNFLMPCDCGVTVSKGISEGATVLPIDLILTVFPDSASVRVQSLMSIEGLARALKGDAVHMKLTDGRSIPVTVTPDESTRAASLQGDLFVPVDLVAAPGALTEEDIGKSAQLRVSKPLLGILGLK